MERKTVDMDMIKGAVSVISVKEAMHLLEAGAKEGIDHVVSVTRDPRNPDRILSIAAIEAEPN